MGGQVGSRREILRLLGIASVAATFPGFRQWVYGAAGEESHDAHMSHASPLPPLRTGPYQPLFFSRDKYAMVEHLAGLIIPTDDTPGAREAGVAEFIDFMVANRVPVAVRSGLSSTMFSAADDTLQQEWLAGINWMNARAELELGCSFMTCTENEQIDFLESLAYKSKQRHNSEAGETFFRLMRDYTVAGYYTSLVGLQSIGYPGLQTHWDKYPGCPHPDDPEHQHLPPGII